MTTSKMWFDKTICCGDKKWHGMVYSVEKHNSSESKKKDECCLTTNVVENEKKSCKISSKERIISISFCSPIVTQTTINVKYCSAVECVVQHLVLQIEKTFDRRKLYGTFSNFCTIG